MIRKIAIYSFLLFSAAAFSAEKTELPARWNYQPATKSSILPDDTLWSGLTTEYKWCGPARGKRWTQSIQKADQIWIRQVLTLPGEIKGKRFFLDFERINGNLIVFVNEKKAGERLGPYGKIEITDCVVPGENTIRIFNTRNYTDTSLQFETDKIRYAARGPHAPGGKLNREQWGLGIEHVKMITFPAPVGIMDAWTETSWRNHEITVNVELNGVSADKTSEKDSSASPQKASLVCEILDAGGKIVKRMTRDSLTLPQGSMTLELRSSWPDPIPWELEKPYLYTAKIQLLDSTGKTLDTETFPFGFREIWTEGRSLMLNGHKARLRIEWSHWGLTENSVSFFKLLGRNAIYFQPNPSSWYRGWGDVPWYSQAILNLTDQRGIAVFLPVPTCSYFRENHLKDSALIRQYREETQEFIRRYRRHPSVLAWCTSMNAFCPGDGIAPNGIGIRHAYNKPQEKVLNKSFEVVKSLDCSRLVYGHAEGNLGDMASGNTYPIFSPLQEVEDWPENWAAHGTMPWWASEYAAIYDGSYFTGKTFLLTEYAAINFGPEAYRMETDRQLKETIDIGLKNTSGHGSNIVAVTSFIPLYWKLQDLYISATDRAWRTWGVTAWHYFNFFVGYGNPPPERKDITNHWSRYADLKQPVTSRPAWANPMFDSHSKNMQPLLAYLAGAPVHTDKAHAFVSGEPVEKQMAFVWDGADPLTLTAEWTLQNEITPKTGFSGKETISLQAGDIRFLPIRFSAPEVREKTNYTLTMTIHGYGENPITDQIPLQVFPKDETKAQITVILFDPAGKSADFLKSTVKTVIPYQKGMTFKSGDILVMGRESVKPEMKMPFRLNDVKNGLKVLFLEQRPEVLEMMGFRMADVSSRVLFFDRNPEELALGLNNQDLRYWRGSTDLLPEFQAARKYEFNVSPKSSNRNVVASTVMEIPAVAGGVPLISGEFDLAYTPLYRMNYGKGVFLFNTLDLSARRSMDPAAGKLGKNLLNYLSQAKNPETPVETIHFGESENPEKIKQTLEAGGTVLYVGLNREQLLKKGIRSERKRIYHTTPAKEGVFANIFPENLLRWRDGLDVDAITAAEPSGEIAGNGLFLLRKSGKGQELFLQVAPEMLATRYENDPVRQEAVQLSVLRLHQLIARAETFFGKEINDETAFRITTPQTPKFAILDTWNILGPFYGKDMSVKEALTKEWPGEKQALSGDLNPNNTYLTPDGRKLDFREEIITDPWGYNNMAGVFHGKGNNMVGYLIKNVTSLTDRTAKMRIGFDYYGIIYVNGKKVFERLDPHGPPKAQAFKFPVELKKGENAIVAKVVSGSNGFGVWADLSEPGDQEGAEVDLSFDPGVKELLYRPEIKIRNPYTFHYW